jgi:heat shock protein HslJ
MKKFLYLLLLPLVLACGSEAEKAKQHSADVAGVYGGNYNCNGCDIGKWVVNLKDDNTFKITFFDRKTKDFAKSAEGIYATENGQITLTSADLEKPHVFDIVSKSSIKIDLGRGQKSVIGSFEKGNATYVENALKGVDVYGVGKTNNWGFKMIFGKGVYLSHPKFGEEIMLPYVKPLADYESHSYTWLWAEEGKEIELIITDKNCDLGMPASMTLKIDGELREGCVQYINPNFLLQNIWQLKRYKGEDLVKERYSRGLPIFEVDAFNVVGMGHTGCNIWSGGIKLNGDKIVIMPGPMSNAKCGWAEFERDFVSTIGQQWRIVYNGNKMELWKEGKAVFEFEKLEDGAVIDATDTEDKNKIYLN